MNGLVGVGVLVEDGDGRVLLGRTRGGPYDGEWRAPGGKTEPGESWEAAGARELAEETGIDGGVVARVVLVDEAGDGLSRVTVGAELDGPAGGPARLAEPEKFTAWEWFRPDALPERLFAPTALLLDALRPGSVPGGAVPQAHRYPLSPKDRQVDGS